MYSSCVAGREGGIRSGECGRSDDRVLERGIGTKRVRTLRYESVLPFPCGTCQTFPLLRLVGSAGYTRRYKEVQHHGYHSLCGFVMRCPVTGSCVTSSRHQLEWGRVGSVPEGYEEAVHGWGNARRDRSWARLRVVMRLTTAIVTRDSHARSGWGGAADATV